MTEQEYKDSKLIFNDKGIFLGDRNIMWEHEKYWIKQEVEKLLNGVNSVLEIGYGLGYTADVFRRKCSRHLIIEPHPVIYNRAVFSGYDVINDFVQNVKLDEYFDLIYDDRQELVYDPDDYSWLNNFNYGRFEKWHAPSSDIIYQQTKY